MFWLYYLKTIDNIWSKNIAISNLFVLSSFSFSQIMKLKTLIFRILKNIKNFNTQKRKQKNYMTRIKRSKTFELQNYILKKNKTFFSNAILFTSWRYWHNICIKIIDLNVKLFKLCNDAINIIEKKKRII